MTDNDRIETTSVSMELPLIVRGRERAKARRQSFSAYVASLIDADLAKASRRSPALSQSQQEVARAA
jgi:hypothetical protein